MTDAALETTCCIAGGGPAGVMLGYLLARQGVRVTVLEKHKDFFRDFRGDTVHPSTLEVLYELGLLDRFLQLPHQKVEAVGVRVGGSAFQVADFRHVPAHCKFVALMPQWDFLNFLSAEAKKFPGFDLRTEHEAQDLLYAGNRITGVRARNAQGSMDLRADLVVGCDGRHSAIRQAAGLELREFGVPIDVLWFRIGRKPTDPQQVLGNVNYGKALILIDRADYFQAGLIIAKGSFAQIKERGLDNFRRMIAEVAPYLGDRVEELRDWEQVKILTVQINRLRRWYREGLLCIGDAAHAMSPAGGVGINLAIQDAVAAANLLARPLLQKNVTAETLAAVQQRRSFPTWITQTVQVQIHKGFAQAFSHPGRLQAPWQLKAALRIPGIQQALGYAVGMGARPEHVASAVREKRQCVPVLKKAAGVIVGFAVALHTFRKLRARAAVNASA
jgi:2-polyprenyl-6-methoxyphenol hydroxylase-like FAD-dependent oxidoreductase